MKKKYQKPSCETIELRAEEHIARYGNCQTDWLSNTNAGNQGCMKTSGS